MKKIALFLIIMLIMSGMASAYSFGDFLNNMGNAFAKFFTLTGFVVLDVVKEASDSGASPGISIPEPPTVKATKEEPVEEDTSQGTVTTAGSSVDVSGSVNEDINGPVSGASNEELQTSGAGEGKVEIAVPSCSDFIDNNVNYIKKGACKDKSSRFEDRCSPDGKSVMEYSCASDGACFGSWYVCPNGCRDGACLSNVAAELKPDLKALSVNNLNGKLVLGVKNLGTKGAFFKTKLVRDGKEEISNIDYYLDAGEVVDVELDDEYLGDYFIELMLNGDSDFNNNKLQGSLIAEAESGKEQVTGRAVAESGNNEVKSKLNIIEKILEFLRKLFS